MYNYIYIDHIDPSSNQPACPFRTNFKRSEFHHGSYFKADIPGRYNHGVGRLSGICTPKE